jgi:DeoR/GlpR family transcriptional regulator of sugar metabolism
MKPNERREKLQAILQSHGNVSVEALARMLSTTTSTIRRDLTRLSAEGRVTRTYGGALAPWGGLREASLRDRDTIDAAEKDAIGRWAAGEIRSGETVIIDGGTTTGRLARHLIHHEGATVITNGLSIADTLRGAENVDLVVLGGSLRVISDSLIGPLTELTLSRVTADRVFLGADGVRADRGICEASPAQTRVKEAMMQAAREIYVVADSSKIGAGPFHAWAPIEGDWTLVTDVRATEAQLAPFRADARVTVITVEPEPPLFA